MVSESMWGCLLVFDNVIDRKFIKIDVYIYYNLLG